MTTRSLTVFRIDRLPELKDLSPVAFADTNGLDLAEAIRGSETYAVEIGGRIEAVVGLHGPVFGTSRNIWVVCTKHAGAGWARFMLRELARKLTEYDEITAVTRAGTDQAVRFLQWLGFRADEVTPEYTFWRIAR